MEEVRIFLTTPGAGTWTVPDDCSSATIECIGAGGGANSGGSSYANGGGGGGYSKKSNVSLTPSSTVNYSVGAIYGGDTWFGNSVYASATVGAKGGGTGGNTINSIGIGGAAESGIGDIKYSGGNGGKPHGNTNYSPGGGGGGAAGPHGDGGTGGNGVNSNVGGAGGTADNGTGGAGGYVATGGNGANGVMGTQWDATHGCGGGGQGYGYNRAGAGANYGGGCGGNGGYGGAGAGQGLIVITYTPAVAGSSKFFQLF